MYTFSEKVSESDQNKRIVAKVRGVKAIRSCSNERAQRSRQHERGTSAERRYKRSHRRSPTSSNHRRQHRHRHHGGHGGHSHRHRDLIEHRDRRSYSSSQESSWHVCKAETRMDDCIFASECRNGQRRGFLLHIHGVLMEFGNEGGGGSGGGGDVIGGTTISCWGGPSEKALT
ncbi:hypothetical protein C0J52_01708 [Blattella germanica]|nr:hypothetical protein C0J52_01708 [Blattella germanica]